MLYTYILPLLELSVICHATTSIQVQEADSAKSFCGSKHPEDNLRLQNRPGFEAGTLARRGDSGLDGSSFKDDGSPIYIDTYVTVVATGHDVEHGYVTQENVDKQLGVLNEAFRGADISFKHMETKWYSEPVWWTSDDRDLDQKKRLMRAMLHRGNYKTLNLIYITEMSPAGLILGDSYPPEKLAQDDEPYYTDGCMISSDQAPNVAEDTNMSGYTTIHQVGEWLGIHHLDKETCDNHDEEYCPGGDPWTNYMFAWKR
ncbi:hypothetical protein HRG_008376 [Hirsutella rhossiliensis]